MSYAFHPIASMFPLLDEVELAALAADIRQHGLREPIVLLDGKVLDGRNRTTACTMAGVEPATKEFHGSEIDAIDFVYSENRRRRHLNSSQAAIVEVKRSEMIEGCQAKLAQIKADAKQRQSEGRSKGGKAAGKGRPKDSSTQTIEQSKAVDRNERSTDAVRAKAAGTNRQYIADAEKIVKHPELAERIEQGKLTIPQAKREIARREKLVAMETKAADAIAKQNGSSPWKIVHGNCLAELPKIKGRARLVFADPPYNIGVDYGRGKDADKKPAEDYLTWCHQWMSLCVNQLTPDGAMWVMICDEWADAFGLILGEVGLERRAWVKWYETFGVNCSGNFNRCSRHLFYCVVNPKKFVFNREAVSRPSDRQTKYQDKRADPNGKILDDVWQVPRLVDNSPERIPGFPTQVPLEIMRRIVGCCSEPGDLIVDPFSGSASTGAAVLELGQGRRYVGIEREERFCQLSTTRLSSILSATDAEPSGSPGKRKRTAAAVGKR